MKAFDLIFNAASPILGRISPTVLSHTESTRRRIALWRQYKRFQAEIKEKLYAPNAPVTVLTGPFQGMRYLDEIVWGSITPRWLGSYESELHPLIQQIVQRAYGTVIDVGSAEGFYAVGLAFRMPKCRLFAFDVDYLSRRQVARLAEMNGVKDRVIIGHYCHHADIDALSVPGDTLLVCDIEGHELGLMDPQKAASLRLIDLLVETHDVKINPIIEKALYERFSPTHTIQRIPETDRVAWQKENVQVMAAIPEELRLKALSEGRHHENPQSWLWMTVNN